MEDMSAIVLEQADRLFQQHIDKQILLEADAGHWPGSLWGALDDAGLPLALVPDAKGGGGLASSVAASLIRRSAFHSVPLPLAETIMANALWTDAGGEVIKGAVTLAPVNPLDRITLVAGARGATLHGTARHVPWGKQALHALVFARDASGKAFLCRVPTAKINSTKARRNVACEPREDIDFDGLHLSSNDVSPASSCLAAEGLMPFGAAIRVQQMIGGMERCMDYALAYANERVQFGRPISKFQAVQHMLAIAAGHFAAASAAATRSPRYRCSATMRLPWRSQSPVAARPPDRLPPYAIRCTAPWDLRRSTRCIMPLAGCGHGATNGAPNRGGRKKLAG